MWVTRARLGSALEWVLAASCILALAALVSFAARQWEGVQTLTSVLAVEAPTRAVPEPSAALPPGAVSVPLVLLSSGAQLRVGETAADIAARIGTAWQVGADIFERTSGGERVTRAYDDGARRFLLVFEGGGESTESRVTAIYLL